MEIIDVKVKAMVIELQNRTCLQILGVTVKRISNVEDTSAENTHNEASEAKE